MEAPATTRSSSATGCKSTGLPRRRLRLAAVRCGHLRLRLNVCRSSSALPPETSVGPPGRWAAARVAARSAGVVRNSTGHAVRHSRRSSSVFRSPSSRRRRPARPDRCADRWPDSVPHRQGAVVAMENRSYGTGSTEIPGSSSDPYIKNTLTAQCGSASDFHASTHPSYPNYLALTSGSCKVTRPTRSATSPARASSARSIRRGAATRSTCRRPVTTRSRRDRARPVTTTSVGTTRRRRTRRPPVGAPTAGDCTTNDVPDGATTSGALHNDAAAGTLPAFSMVTPGLCDDMHAVPTGDTSCPDQIKGGDNWLATWIPILTRARTTPAVTC